jgi:hypothetical protein
VRGVRAGARRGMRVRAERVHADAAVSGAAAQQLLQRAVPACACS